MSNNTFSDDDLTLAIDWQSTKDKLRGLLKKYEGTDGNDMVAPALDLFRNSSSEVQECVFVYLMGTLHALNYIHGGM